MMLMNSEPITTSSGFVSITITSTCSIQGVGDDVVGAFDGNDVIGASVGTTLSQIGSQGS